MAKMYREDRDVINAMACIVGTAKNIYKNEPLERLQIMLSKSGNKNYIKVEAIPVDSEYWSCWDIAELENKEEVEIVKKLLRRVQFKNEYVKICDGGNTLHIDIQNSPRLQAVRDAVFDLKQGKFYDELHREDEGYTVITKDVRGLKEFQKRHSDVVRVYNSDFGRDLYDVYIS